MSMNKLLAVALITLIAVGCSKNSGQQPSQTVPEAKNDTIKLSFHSVSKNEIQESKPKQEWSEVKSLDLGAVDGKTAYLRLYSDGADARALVEHSGKFYVLGAFSLKDVEANKLSVSFDGIDVLAGIGTNSTYWKVIGLDKKSGKLVSFDLIGRPEIIDLDVDGNKELVAAFEGTNLNFPNVEIVRSKDGLFESAKVIEEQNLEDPKYARLAKKDTDTVIEVGKVREESSKRYKYENGRLVVI